MSAHRRAFVGVELSGDVLDGLSQAQRDLDAMARRLDAELELVPRALLHIPLDDLGECTAESIEAVEVAIERALPRHPPFAVQIRGFGAFPDRERPRIVWAGVEDKGDRLAALRASLHDALAAYGFAVEPGEYVPHIPLARVGARFGALGDAFGPTPFGRVRVRRLTVFRRRAAAERGDLFQAVHVRDLQTFPDRPEAVPDDAARRRHIIARLDARLGRAERPGPPRQQGGRR